MAKKAGRKKTSPKKKARPRKSEPKKKTTGKKSDVSSAKVAKKTTRRKGASALRIHTQHVDFLTYKVDQLRKFYDEILELHTEIRDTEGLNYLQVTTSETSTIGFMPPHPEMRGEQPLPREPTLYFVVKDVDKAYAQLMAKGAAFMGPPQEMPWGYRVVTTTDPEGRSIMLASKVGKKIIVTTHELFPYIRSLVDIPSVSGNEGDVARFLSDDLTTKGFQVTLQKVAADRLNVYATSEGVAPRVVFNTHIDTVPPFYASSEDDDYIYGRGSCDAKGIAATMIFATMALRDAGIRDVGVLLVVGEEVDSAGATVANELESESRYVIVGEPTENRMATGHKGGFKFRLTARGKAAHSAYPHLGESAIAFLLDVLAEIRAQDWGKSDILGDATTNVGTFHGGLAANVFAPEAEADVFIRVVGQVADVQAKIDGILERHPKVSYELIAKSDAVFCETQPGFEVAPVSFGTDIPALHAFGKPLLLGPGSIHDAHTDSEKLGKREALDAVSYYQRLVKQLLGSL